MNKCQLTMSLFFSPSLCAPSAISTFSFGNVDGFNSGAYKKEKYLCDRFCNPTSPKHAGGIRFCVGGDVLQKLLLQQYCTRIDPEGNVELVIKEDERKGDDVNES